MARPKPELTEDQMRQLETMAGYGLTVDKMAAILGFSKKTLERIMADNPAVSDAIEKGRSTAESAITKTAYEMAKSGKVPAMTMFWLKCRARWREVHSVELSGPDGGPLRLEELVAGSGKKADGEPKD